ncbi:MAG: SEC-C domain-containing protein [Ardenticatenaceae bacterium]|nr:SEC-C domain-containing protein [Ardenticatenaceae bacterium]MCB9004664.1 SEC-C domain-containing protein [Ardenticatenaceae bacterium]
MDKPGRNDPCYCGSGKKYKKCHMPIDQQKEKEKRDWVQAANFLSRNFMLFARDERFAEDFAQALALYWNEMYTIDNAEEMSQPEALRFFDWFVFDYPLADGTRLIDTYRAEKWDDLSAVQQAALERWVAESGSAWAYTLTDYDADKLYLQDFLFGESFAVEEPGGRGVVEIGEVILARLVPVYDHLEFSTSAAYLPADEIGDLKAKLETAQTADATAHPDATPLDFMRRNNHVLIHHALEQAEKKGRPPVARLDPNRSDKAMQKAVRMMRRR